MIARGEGPTHYAQSKDSGRAPRSHRTEDTNNELPCPPLVQDSPQDPNAQEDRDNDEADLLACTDIDALEEDVLGEDGINQDDSHAEIFLSGARELQDRLIQTDEDYYFSKAADHHLLTPEQETEIARRRDKAFDSFLHALYSCEVAVNDCVSAIERSILGTGDKKTLQDILDLRLLGMKPAQAKWHCQKILPTIAELRKQAETLYATAIAQDPSGAGTSPAWATLTEVRLDIATLVVALGVRRDIAETYRQKVVESANLVESTKRVKTPTTAPENTSRRRPKLNDATGEEKPLDVAEFLAKLQETRTSLEDKNKRIDTHFKEYLKARDEFVAANLRLAISEAKRYIGRGLDFIDLVQEANRGVIAAAEKFDPSFGGKFSTYAVPWIKQKVQKALVDQGHPIRVPVDQDRRLRLVAKSRSELLSRLGRPPRPEEIAEHATARAKKTLEKKLVDILRTQHGRDPTPEEIAERLEGTRQTKISAEDVVVLLRAAATPRSLDQPAVGDATENYESFAAGLPDPRSEPVARENLLRQGQLKKDLSVLLQRWLTPRERIIVEMRFGLGTHQREYTLAEIGKVLNITRERVRQLEEKVLNKLRALESIPELRALK